MKIFNPDHGATPVHDVVAAIIQKRLGIKSELKPAMQLVTDLGISSIRMITILTDACGALGIDLMKLRDAEVAGLQTIGDITSLLSAKRP